MNHQVVGLDIGHSATKMTLNGKAGVERVLFPSLATPAFKIAYEAEAARAANETVTVNGRDWFVGETARIQADRAIKTGLTDEWILGDDHEALVAYAAKIADAQLDGGQRDDRVVVVGLPVSSFQRLKDKLREQVSRHFADARIVTIPQPLSGYFNLIADRDGSLRSMVDVSEAAYAVVDVGHFTSDFIMMAEGARWVQKSSGSGPGAHIAALNLQERLKELGINVGLIACERAVRERELKAAKVLKDFDLEAAINQAAAPLAEKVVNQFDELIGDRIYELDAIVLVGGGAALVHDSFKSRWGNVMLVEDEHQQPAAAYCSTTLGVSPTHLKGSRFLISEGYYRYGQNLKWVERINNTAA
jgi:plasmid segregation protein ParM